MASQWQSVTGNVMMFVPSPSPVPALIEQSLSRLSVFDADSHYDQPLPSIETPSPIQTGSTYDEPIDLSSSEELTPDCSGSSQSSSSTTLDQDSARVWPSGSLNFPSHDVGYESDRTDFRELSQEAHEVETPCPTHTGTRRIVATNKLRYNSISTSKNAKVNRVLQFGIPKSSNKKRPRAPEYSENHRWTPAQRTLLCVLFRFYKRDVVAFKHSFNDAFNLDLPKERIRAQFENEVRFYGPEAFPMYEAVFSTPINDPEGIYADIRARLEEAAERRAFQLERVTEDTSYRSSDPIKSKSRLVRKRYKTLIKNASPEHRHIFRGTFIGFSELHVQEEVDPSPIDQNASSTIDPDSSLEISIQLQSQHFEDPQPGPVVAPNMAANITSKIAFRVWDSESGSQYVEGRGFMSSLHMMMKDRLNLFERPFDPDGRESERAFYLLAAMHLHHQGGRTGFVSVTTSLLQALAYCKGKKDAMIAVVDLQHPSLHTANKLHHAADIIRWLRMNKEADWSRFYRGSTEYIAWRDIPEDAILSTFPVLQLFSLANRRPSCAQVLDVDLLTSGKPVSAIAKQLQEGQYITKDVATGMGRIAREFGFANFDLQYITAFVEQLVSSFYLKMGSADIHTQSTIASAFAVALKPEGRLIQDVMDSFLDRVQKGTEYIQSWKRKTKPSR